MTDLETSEGDWVQYNEFYLRRSKGETTSKVFRVGNVWLWSLKAEGSVATKQGALEAVDAALRKQEEANDH